MEEDDNPKEKKKKSGKGPKGNKAVKGTSFGVKSGECFSLLGVKFLV